MSFTDLFDSGEHRRNLGHFASIVNLAAADGDINQEEEAVLKRLAIKLDIDESEYQEIIQTPAKYPINPPNTKEKRLERLYDALTIIFADHEMDEPEALMLKRYAVGLGFSSEDSTTIIKRSIKILGNQLSFEDYLYLLHRK